MIVALATRRWLAPAAVAATAVAGCAAIWVLDPTTPGGFSPICPTKLLFGIDCPGCGGQRMVYALLHGDVAGAAHYNALGLVALVLLVWAYVAWVARLARVPWLRVSEWKHWRYSPHVMLAAVLVWFVIRNLPWAPFTGLKV